MHIPELDLGSKIANNTRDYTEDDGGPRGDITRCWSGRNETGNTAGTPSNHTPFLCKSEIQDAPGHRCEHGSQARVPACHHGAKVSPESRSSVESQPSKPEENRDQGNERNVVWSEVQHHLLLALSKDHRICQCRHTRNNFNRSTSCVVENTIVESPAVYVPYPASDGAVDESRPEEDENHSWDKSATFGNCSHDNGSRDTTELKLKEVLIFALVAIGMSNSYLVERIE